MKSYKKILGIVIVSAIILVGCTDLNLSPLSQASSRKWYSNQTQIEMALNDQYRGTFWPLDSDSWTDDWTQRNLVTPITNGTMDGQTDFVVSNWQLMYKGISRANKVIESLDRVKEKLTEETVNRFEGEARFIRASRYAYLISHYGDVPYFIKVLDLDKAFTLKRTDKSKILQAIYDDYDYATAHLPVSYSDADLRRATKGAALALKARIALYMGDWSVAKDAAKATMELGIYELYPDYAKLFLSSTKNAKEDIFVIPRSVELDDYLGESYPVKATIIRNAGGWAAYNPSWDLFSSYLCTDGKPIDESPEYDTHHPFQNRDPRLAATIVPFQTEHLGYIYQPHPDSLQVWSFSNSKYVTNNDTRSNTQYASYNGLVWNKGVDMDWVDLKTDPDDIIIRYADVLLMYAEAKIELGEIDQSVLDAINMVRARAYAVDKSATSQYPAVTTTDQNELRKAARIERRMEFAKEGLRYMDLIRWKLADKALNNDIYGMLDPQQLRDRVISKGNWFFPEITPVDEDGIADFTPMYNEGLVKKLVERTFDANRQYLWPIPTKEIQINENLTQNPGY